jgi:hypothetical protein
MVIASALPVLAQINLTFSEAVSTSWEHGREISFAPLLPFPQNQELEET